LRTFTTTAVFFEGDSLGFNLAEDEIFRSSYAVFA